MADKLDSDMEEQLEEALEEATGTAVSRVMDIFRDLAKSFIPKSTAELITPSDDSEHTGVLVCLQIDEDTAKAIAVPGGVPPEELHITVAYYGDSNKMDDQTIARIIDETANVAKRTPRLYGNVHGNGRFNASPTSDDMDVITLNPDIVGLVEMRQSLVNNLAHSNIQPESQHGYTPHITVDYVEKGAPSTVETVPTAPLSFQYLTLMVGDKVTTFPLSGYPYGSDGAYIYSMCDTDNGDYRLFNEFEFAEPPERINYMPVPGTYSHNAYGPVKITKKRNANFADNFNAAVYQQRIPIDAEHETKLSGAMGWITSMEQNKDGSVDALVEWTPRGEQLIKEDAFKYFSPEWYDAWQDPATDDIFDDVAIGGALTTRPFFKEKALRPLVASENGDKEGATIPTSWGLLRIKDMYSTDGQTAVGETGQFSELGDKIKAERDGLGMSRADLADVLGISASTLGALERGDNAPSDAVAKRLTSVLKIPVSEMGSTAKEPKEAQMAEQNTPDPVKMREELDDLRAQVAINATEAQARKASDEEARTAAEARDTENKQLSERIATMENEAQTKRFTELTNTNGQRWFGEVAPHVAVLETLAKTYGDDSDEFKGYVSQQKAMAEQIATSKLFAVVGNDMDGDVGDATARLDKAAVKIASEKGITKEAAMTAALEDNPALYDEVQKEAR